MRTLRALITGGGMVLALLVRAQCTTTISTFPYNEGFETDPAWTSGGNNSDWEWGVPAHPTINVAAQGSRAWCVGGLNGSFYANGQQSWLETPCFDLSVLNYPYLSFSIFWETEPNYDGIGLQYSPNQGVTWINVGAVGNADCMTSNWFNSASIYALNLASPKQGWSGTSVPGGCANGGGSGGWVVAAHCLDDLPTNAPVKFRFIFGAGTQCNEFDGVGIDQVYVGEAPGLDPAINFVCSGTTVNFSNSATICPANSTWNFGDPDSGANNTATGATASHAFVGSGNHTISLTMTGPCAAPVTITTELALASLTFVSTDVGCVPNSGSATANVAGSAGPFTYDWSPGDQSTQTITGLSPGNYTVLVQAPDICPVQGTVTIGTLGSALSATATHTDVSCAGLSDGSVNVTASGGTAPYSFTWSPTGGDAAIATGLAAGGYSCAISDDAGCSAEVDVTISQPEELVLIVENAATICSGRSITLTADADGGVPAYSFMWSPSGPDVSPLVPTAYTVVATDANGCTSDAATVTVDVTENITPNFAWDVSSGCAPLCVTFSDDSAVEGVRAWAFGDGTADGDTGTPQHCYSGAGSFDVTLSITTVDGCTGSFVAVDAITIFTPPDASISVSPTVALVDEPTFRFTHASTNEATRLWSFGDPLNSTSTDVAPSFTYAGVGCYDVFLDVISEEGCTDRAEALVCVEDAFALYAPNTFTPNNDGINDGFFVTTTVTKPSFFQLDIYDRWGHLAHTSGDPYSEWDGSGMPQSVYIWKVRVRDAEEKLQERTGHVVLVR